MFCYLKGKGKREVRRDTEVWLNTVSTTCSHILHMVSELLWTHVSPGLRHFPKKQRSLRNAWMCECVCMCVWVGVRVCVCVYIRGRLQVESLFTVLSKGFGISLICVGVQQKSAQYSHWLQYVQLSSGFLCKSRCVPVHIYDASSCVKVYYLYSLM